MTAKKENPRKTEFPILFNTDMVRAITLGHKLQTRRIVNPRNLYLDGGKPPILGESASVFWKKFDFDKAVVDPVPSPSGNHGPYLKVPNTFMDTRHRVYPKREVGDLLWVRETFAEVDGVIIHKEDFGDSFTPEWEPSIFMPKDAARIWLQINSIRVERLKDISDKDAIMEGIDYEYSSERKDFPILYMDYIHGDYNLKKAKDSFLSLWESINGKESLEENPWVWVYNFDVLSLWGKPKNWKGKQTRVDEEAEKTVEP